MAYAYLLIGLTTFGLWVFCLFDAIFTDEYRCRNLQKTLWILIIVLIPTIGSIAWLVAGRPNDGGGNRYSGQRWAEPAYHEPEPEPDPEAEQAEFERRFRERVEEQRRERDR